MRKYLVAVAVGAMLIASQAAADENAVVGVGDQVGSPTAVANDMTGNQTFLVLLFAALFIGLAAWGLSTNGNGHPASP